VFAAAVACAGCGSAAHVPDRFSGTWRLNDGRTISLHRAVDGEAALRRLGGAPCHGRALYFRARYFGGRAQLAGCTTGDGRRLVGRFDDNGIHGTIVQRYRDGNPPTFVASVRGDGHAAFRVVATRIRAP
jgi:hypothetical protein